MSLKRFAFLLAMLALAACGPSDTSDPTSVIPTDSGEQATSSPTESQPSSTDMPTRPGATAIPPTPTLVGRIGPTSYPEGINPLTGLAVSDLAVLDRPPLLIKVSNYPAVVRPQSGLMSADHVWEHNTEGVRIATRYLAVFLTSTPERVGSIRSGRLPDLEIVPMYDGIYVASGFSSNRNAPETPPRMGELMRAANWVDHNFSYEFGYHEPYTFRLPLDGVAVEHTLFANPAELWTLAAERQIGASSTLSPGLAFDLTAPGYGIATATAEVNYPGTAAQNTWIYDSVAGKWLLWTDGEMATDALTGQQLAFSNVVIIYADHYTADFVETEPNWYGLGADLTGTGGAVLLRDGTRYDIHWSRSATNSMIQFYGIDGEIIPFKPGNTWFHMASSDFEWPEVVFDQGS
nr:DUF3048 C-terminal domain-containing protein [Anaerolineae bacterium]